MLSEPRAIFFETVLEWPPLAHFRLTEDVVRSLFNKLFDIEFPFEAYRSIDLQSDQPTLSSKSEECYSECRFGANSIAFQENNPNLTHEDFARKVVAVLGEYAKACSELDIEPPPVIFQKCRLRCLARPATDALELLAGRVAQVLEHTEKFERPPQFFGVRFRFPPVVIESEDGEEEGSLDDFTAVRFETHSADPSQIWMEVAATHFFTTALHLQDEADRQTVSRKLDSSYEFLTEKCVAFLNQFDEPRPDSGGLINDDNRPQG